ncbi:hypothetical protein L6452_36376 [Arctium lappa]|uniref:Uncharacterized protein n=1 Tax=Arctium lappa TaxID=4217 RepID=A0ACB8Y9P3_ARCLA|nr:hypothetical protein L6452_36376 [Arctium lappa]
MLISSLLETNSLSFSLSPLLDSKNRGRVGIVQRKSGRGAMKKTWERKGRWNGGGRKRAVWEEAAKLIHRTPSSSQLSSFIVGNDDWGADDNRERERKGGRRDFDTNRKPNYQNHDEYRSINRASSEVSKADHQKQARETYHHLWFRPCDLFFGR